MAPPLRPAGSSDSVPCPRCGYDLRGLVEAWDDRCDLRGTCAECGLEFAWRFLLDRSLELPGWCVESPGRRLVTPAQIAGTFVRSFRPWRFWSSIRLTHPRRWGRLAAYVAAQVLLLYGVFCAANGFVAHSQWQRFLSSPGATTTTPPGVIVRQAVLLPFSPRSAGGFADVTGRPFSSLPPRHLVLIHWPPVLLVALAGLLGYAGSALAFALLPVARRRARVRWAHLVRVTLYGTALLLPLAVLLVLDFGLRFDAGRANPFFWTHVVLGSAVAIPLCAAWWTAAASRYLRMEHPAAVGASVTMIGFLVPGALLALVSYW